MYYVSAQGLDEHVINVYFYYYYVYVWAYTSLSEQDFAVYQYLNYY